MVAKDLTKRGREAINIPDRRAFIADDVAALVLAVYPRSGKEEKDKKKGNERVFDVISYSNVTAAGASSHRPATCGGRYYTSRVSKRNFSFIGGAFFAPIRPDGP